MAAEKWIPTEKPFRVSWTVRAAYPANWISHVEVFATLAEAKAEFEKPSKFRGLMSVSVDEAGNPDNWNARGYWKRIISRKPYAKKKV